MKFFGSATGNLSNNLHQFSKDDIIEADEGEFNAEYADIISEEKQEVKEEVNKVSKKKRNKK